MSATAPSTFKRTQRITDEENGKYLLEWLDENEEVLVSMELEISETDSATIQANFRLMKEQNKGLFIDPAEETEIIEEDGNE